MKYEMLCFECHPDMQAFSREVPKQMKRCNNCEIITMHYRAKKAVRAKTRDGATDWEKMGDYHE